MSSNSSSVMANEIKVDKWTLFDKLMYGGLGYGAFCFPTDFFKVIIAILFPPLGEVLNILDDTITADFPYVSWECIKKLCEYENIKRLVYSFVLTALFYVPGLVYTLTGIVEQEKLVPKTTKANTFISISGFDDIPNDDTDDTNDTDEDTKTVSNVNKTLGKL
jgi:uncharacterized membrane protein YqaE (UPF0057 family)